MSLFLCCYTTLSAGEAAEVLAKLQRERPDVFPDLWWLGDIRKPVPPVWEVESWRVREIERAHGFTACSEFVASWQKEDWELFSSEDVVTLLESTFGALQVLVLENDEVLVKAAVGRSS